MVYKEEYYVYSLFGINLIGIMYFLFNLSETAMMFEAFIVFLAIITPIYLIYSFEKEKEKPYMHTMVFFAVMSINSALIYILTKKIDSAFLGLLNVLGIFLTTMIIPGSAQNKSKDSVSKKRINPDFARGIEPLKEVFETSVSSESRKPEYLIRELERELEKAEKKHLHEQKKEEAMKRFDEEKSILDDPEIIDESEIVIEEIKPTKETDLHPHKKSKRNIAKKGIEKIEKLLDTIEKVEEEDYDKKTEGEEVIIEEIKPTIEKDLHPRKKSRKPARKVSLKKIENLVSEIEKIEEEEYDKLTDEEEVIIEELKPIRDLPKSGKRKKPSKSKKRISKRRR